MKHRRIGWTILCVLVMLASVVNPVLASKAGVEEASALYQQGDYKQAYKTYLKLGKEGDSYSAYRISYMRLFGQGTKADFIESLAWATIAAQKGEKDLVNYRDTVAAMVPKDERKKASSKVDYYLRRWGEKQAQGGRHTQKDCTGSRVSSNCNPGSSSRHRVSWPQESQDLQVMQLKIEQLDQEISEHFDHNGVNDSAGS